MDSLSRSGHWTGTPATRAFWRGRWPEDRSSREPKWSPSRAQVDTSRLTYQTYETTMVSCQKMSEIVWICDTLSSLKVCPSTIFNPEHPTFLPCKRNKDVECVSSPWWPSWWQYWVSAPISPPPRLLLKKLDPHAATPDREIVPWLVSRFAMTCRTTWDSEVQWEYHDIENQ